MNKITVMENLSPDGNIYIDTDTINEPSYPIHSHKFHELVIIMGGAGKHVLNQFTYPLEPGDVFVLKGSDTHGFTDMHNLSLYNIMYHPDHLNYFNNSAKSLPGFYALFLLEPIYRKQHRFQSKLHLSQEKLQDVHRIVSLMHAEQDARNPGYESMVHTYFIQLTIMLSRQYQPAQFQNSYRFMALAETIMFIENHYMESFTLEQMAQTANLSVNQFLRVFRKLFGTSPVNHINKLRVMKACEYFACSPEMNVTQVAYQVGFSDSNYFSRVFKACKGISPAFYKHNLRNQ